MDNEISSVRELGVEIKTDSPVKSVDELFGQGYKAIFIAAGCWTSLKLNVPGEDAQGVIPALSFLKRRTPEKKSSWAIGWWSLVGAVRLLTPPVPACVWGQGRSPSLYRRSQAEMPAQDVEVEQAKEEGVVIHDSCGVAKIVSSNGKVSAVETGVSVFDAEGRCSLQYCDGPAPTIEADTVIVAIGQKPDTELFPELEKTPSGMIKVDEETLETSVKGVFAGGDVVTGPSDVVNATASGKEAAISIGLLLSNRDMRDGRPPVFKAVEDIPTEGVLKSARQVEAVLEPENG